MARFLRIEYPGALYHITSRGNRKKDIFTSNSDRRLFLKILTLIVKKYNWLCHAQTLMDNHYHLVLETPDANLSKGMKDLNGEYAQKFNFRNSKVGHLFQGRYKAFIIEKEMYLLNVARYSVLNSVRAGLVDHPRKYAWSSFRATAGLDPVPEYLTTDWILSYFSDNKKEAQKEYQRFVLEGLKDRSPFEDIAEGIILGSDQFTDEVWEKIGPTEEIAEVPRSDRFVGRPSLDELFSSVDSLEMRNRAIQIARNLCGYSNTEIGKFLGIDNSTVCRIARGDYPGVKS